MNTLREFLGSSDLKDYESLLAVMFDISKDEFDDDSGTQLDLDNDEGNWRRKNPFNKLLPYAEEVDDEAQKVFADIKAKLGRAVMLREMYPGCCEATSRLFKYIYLYGMNFSKEDHILLIKLYYELTTIPDLEPLLIYSFARILSRLLRQIELIQQDELELDWRPLYNQMTSVLDHKLASLGIYRFLRDMNLAFSSLIRIAKNYFPLSATREILDELRPKLCPYDFKLMNSTVKRLSWFLPELLPPQHHSLGYELWFSEFMKLWEVCHNATAWENDMMELVSNIGEKNIGYIDWDPYLPLMFTRIIKSLNLPVYYKKKKHTYNYKLGSQNVARWIISTLGNGSKAQGYLDKFLKTVETYLHPTNYGPWAPKLMELVKKISHYFVVRLHKERFKKQSWIPTIPNSCKLTDSEINDFVKSMMPLALNSIFSKSYLISFNACFTLQNLANVRPNFVVPILLERVDETFESLNEPNRFTSLIRGLSSVSRQLCQGPRNVNTDYAYGDGPAQVVPLLFAVLPGIDHNDFIKSQMVFDFITTIVAHCPLVDSSKTQAILNDGDRLVCESTSRFEDFILQFLDRIFTLVELSSVDVVRQESDLSRSSFDAMAENLIFELLSSIFFQASDELFEAAVYKFRKFVIEKTQETKVAGQLVINVCKMFVKTNASIALPILLPVLSQTVLDLIDEVDDISKEENLDNRLLYTLLVLSGTLNSTGNFILPYIDTLTNVLDKVLHLKSREGSNITYAILEEIFAALSDISLNKAYRIDRDYSNPECVEVLDWGQPTSLKNIRTEWYVPGEKEIAVAQKLFTKYMVPEIERIEKFIADPNSVTRDDLFDSLNIVYEIITGCENLLPVWEEPPLVLEPSVIGVTSFTHNVGVKGEIRMPDGSNVRLSLAKIFTRLQEVILKSAEDDTKSIGILLGLWQNILLGKFRLKGEFLKENSVCQSRQKMWEDKLTAKGGNVVFFWDRIIIQHEARLQFQNFAFTETHKHIMLQLMELATSRYAKVRSVAQAVLSDAMSYLPQSYKVLVPYILEILAGDTSERHDAYKGALYILMRPRHNMMIMKQNWSLLRTLWPALVLAKPSEKLSVINLEDHIICSITKGLLTFQIKLEIPDSCVSAASRLWDSSSTKPEMPRPTEDEIEKGKQMLAKKGQENLESYKDLVDTLMEIIIEKNLHWRHRLAAMKQIKELSHPQVNYSSKVVKYFLAATINESIFERQIALKIILCAMKQQKREHIKVEFDLSKIRNVMSDENFHPGERTDNAWLQYNSKTRPLTAEQWDEPRFVHKLYVGYYTWPKKLEVYAPSSQQPTLDMKVRKLTDVEQEIHNFFIDPHNVEKLIHYLSLEEKKGKEMFKSCNFLLFKFLFGNHGDVFLDNFLPHLRRLVADKQESSQRCAAELLAGIIKGSKHWTFEMVTKMWKEINPIVKSAMSNLTNESIGNWNLCFAKIQYSMDPNKIHWLLECLMDELPLGQTEASLVECGRLSVLQSVLTQIPWRVSELYHRLLICLEERLNHNPFQMLRNHLGYMLATIFAADLKFEENPSQTAPRARVLIEKLSPKLQILAENSNLFPGENSLSTGVACVRLVEKMEEDDNNDQKIKDEERTAAIKVFKTICRWMLCNAVRGQISMHPSFFEFFLMMCQLENCDTDDELTSLCSSTLAALARSLIMPNNVPKILEEILKASRNTSWWVRATTLDFLEVFVFHNMSILLSQDTWIETIQETVLRLLEDERLEVREKSSQVLGGLLHCAFIPDKETLLEEFKIKSRTRIRKRKHKIAPGAEERANTEEINAVLRRHAGILGLCAFIQAHPYDIPSYVPSIFEHLGSHLHDPEPIPATIRKTLGNFKRTHYDGWSVHAQQFTEEQLEVLQDLIVPPAHYA